MPGNILQYSSAVPLKRLGETSVLKDTANGVGQSFCIPEIGLNSMWHNFRNTGLIGNNDRHSGCHGFKWRDAEWLRYGGHNIHVGNRPQLAHLLAAQKSREVKVR